MNKYLITFVDRSSLLYNKPFSIETETLGVPTLKAMKEICAIQSECNPRKIEFIAILFFCKL